MAIKLFNPQWVIDHLDVQVPDLRQVSGAAQLARAAENLKQTPSAFVLPNAERPSGNSTGTMVVRQQNTVRFGVILAVQNLSDSRGQKAQADLRVLRTQIMAVLLGWEPDEDMNPIEYTGGRLMQVTDQVLWWQDDFLTTHYLRSM